MKTLETKTTLEDLLNSHRLSYTFEEGEERNGLSLLDRLTPEGDSDVTRGLYEISFLAEEIENEFILPTKAENERLQQQLKEKDDLEDARKRYYEDKLESMQISLNNQYNELKSAQELIREKDEEIQALQNRLQEHRDIHGIMD